MQVLVASLIVALVAIRKRIQVSVVEQTFVSIAPGELLQVEGGVGGAKQSEVSVLRFARLDSGWCGRPDGGTLVRMRRWL